jgi:protein tyrosine phosphatase (PTP) superfamily phosphohydrolase (DUF442 family)
VKKYWGVLCVASLLFAQIALGDGTPAGPQPAAPAAASAHADSKKAWPESTSASHRLKEDGVPNFGRLNDYIWRSGQPSLQGYLHLAAAGLKTVVNLRKEFPQDKDRIPPGVQYVYIPITDEHEPTDEQAKEFLKVASNPDNWPLLVHCAGGEGRAGVMSALVRRTLDGWDHNMIMKEVGNFRLKHLGFITVPMAGCQRKFIQHWEDTTEVLRLSPPSQTVAP